MGREKGFLLLLQSLPQTLALFMACRYRKISQGRQCLLQAFRLRPQLREPISLLSELLLGKRKAAPSFSHRSLHPFTARKESGQLDLERLPFFPFTADLFCERITGRFLLLAPREAGGESLLALRFTRIEICDLFSASEIRILLFLHRAARHGAACIHKLPVPRHDAQTVAILLATRRAASRSSAMRVRPRRVSRRSRYIGWQEKRREAIPQIPGSFDAITSAALL